VVDLLNTAKVKTFDAGAPDLDATPGAAGWGWQGTPGQSRFLPYRIVYPIAGGIFEGTLGEPSDDASLVFQVTCVGRDRPQCESIVDDTNLLLVERRPDLIVAGRYVTRVWCEMTGGARRDDTTQPPVFVATPQYRVDTTPLTGGGS
jgi:hypothetical protein